MAKRLSRGRGPRITDDELDKMVALYLEGKTLKAIAKEVGRHWQTVRKYAVKALREREGQELRREALKSALLLHFQDLVGALGSLTGLLEMPEGDVREPFQPWQRKSPARREHLLLQALREAHAKEAPLWAWFDRWNQDREAYDRAILPLRDRITSEMATLSESPGVVLTNKLHPVLLTRGLSVARGGSIYDPEMLRVVHPPSDSGDPKGSEELWLAYSNLLAEGQGMEKLRQNVAAVMTNMAEWEETKELARLYREMADLKAKMEEEAEVLSLRRAFTGRCRLCPV